MFKNLKNFINDAKTHYGIGLNMAMQNFNNSLNSIFIDREFFDDDFFEDLEEKLIELDIMPTLAIILVQEIEKKIYNKRVNRDEFSEVLYDVISNHVELDKDNDLSLVDDELNVFLIVGINGVGKTTSISKLANLHKDKKVHLAAADTFRAGAIDQLKAWAERLDVTITKTHMGHAPSAVIYDALDYSVNNKVDLLICDTAGRLHNKDELMQELKKIHTIIAKKDDVKINLKTILVLDSTAGKNTIEQARAFNEITSVDGIVVTKMDSDAKVGMIINISYELNKPIYYVTNGEQINDIKKFDSQMYLSMLFEEK